jgi:hypothetical protein
MSCNHLIIKLAEKYVPYRYICSRCGKLLKIASGIHVPNAEVLKRITGR